MSNTNEAKEAASIAAGARFQAALLDQLPALLTVLDALPEDMLTDAATGLAAQAFILNREEPVDDAVYDYLLGYTYVAHHLTSLRHELQMLQRANETLAKFNDAATK